MALEDVIPLCSVNSSSSLSPPPLGTGCLAGGFGDSVPVPTRAVVAAVTLPLQELWRLGIGLPGPRHLIVSLASSL